MAANIMFLTKKVTSNELKKVNMVDDLQSLPTPYLYGFHLAYQNQQFQDQPLLCKILNLGVDKNDDFKVDVNRFEEGKVGDDVVVKPHVDISSEEVVVGLKGKDKVKKKVVHIAKSLLPIPKPLPSFPQRLMKQTLDANIERYIEQLKEAIDNTHTHTLDKI
ncbi:hypothetical protein HAX54_019097 [Datura stramonium]|uniref:Uncharacterized protein n=1 Tax=Datura stramonium TaxID=4076 RepID=A0ABS8S1N6_DATST|nr:hypothetical protein [Datura stramonium]